MPPNATGRPIRVTLTATPPTDTLPTAVSAPPGASADGMAHATSRQLDGASDDGGGDVAPAMASPAESEPAATDLAPASTEPAPAATEPAPAATDLAPAATDLDRAATDLSPAATDPAPAATAEGVAVSDGVRPARPRGGRAPAPRAFPRADRPGQVPTPEHHHLPGWVRRDFARSRPALADLLGLLQGEERSAFQKRVEELTVGINAGKFSLAWQYPGLIEDGRRIYEGQKAQIQETQRVSRELDRARRATSERLRDAAGLLAPDAAARLQRTLRTATSSAALTEVDAEVTKVLAGAHGGASKRRQREIERTRSRILRALPASALAAEEPSESWQDVLRRFADGQSEG